MQERISIEKYTTTTKKSNAKNIIIYFEEKGGSMNRFTREAYTPTLKGTLALGWAI